MSIPNSSLFSSEDDVDEDKESDLKQLVSPTSEFRLRGKSGEANRNKDEIEKSGEWLQRNEDERSCVIMSGMQMEWMRATDLEPQVDVNTER